MKRERERARDHRIPISIYNKRKINAYLSVCIYSVYINISIYQYMYVYMYIYIYI